MKIGKVQIANNVILAPMAGVTDYPMRSICKDFGVGLLYTEMVSAKALYYKDEKTKKLLKTNCSEKPISAQIFGSEPKIMAYAAKYIEDLGFDILDINMGCPTPKIVKNGEGSALMKNPNLISDILHDVVKAVKIPVTIKIRTGWDDTSKNAVEIAKIAESFGVSAIAVHGRTKEMMYSGFVDLDTIKKVKMAVKISVIANGDIKDAFSAKNTLEYTNADAIMIGRAALGNPFIFEKIVKYLNNNEIIDDLSIQKKLEIINKHLNLLVLEKGEYIGIKEARKHILWYVKGFRNASKIKELVNRANTLCEMEKILNSVD